uniref:Calponin-homology (CH) domain-containing protein n=1 Tax=Romanomermis culicivorax TaxID=13658 RepID=A0A915L3X8_ROMCU
MANRGPNYGLSLEIEKKNKAKFVLADCQEILTWLEQCTNLKFEKDIFSMTDDSEVADALKDGVQLCA